MASKGRHLIIAGTAMAAPALFALACRFCPAFERAVLDRLSLPAMLTLHRLAAPLPFPLAEVLAIAVAAVALWTLAAAALRSALRRAVAPVLRWLRGFAAAALLLAAALALLWLPAVAQPVEAPPTPDARQLAWLCGQLIDRLNAAPPDFPPLEEALSRAPCVAGVDGRAAVKAARYPEWMRAASISGLFVPLTGEALVDAGAPAPLAPFTAVHELMHLTGIADEGAANIAAWERCVAEGGPFAASARLWALRYAMGLLRRADPDAWRQAAGKMKDPLAQVYHLSGGEAASGRQPLAGLPGLARCHGDYAALAGYLIRRGAS